MDDKPDSEAAKPVDAPAPAPADEPVMDVVSPPPAAPAPEPAPPADSAPPADDNKPHDPPPDNQSTDNGQPAAEKPKTKLDPSLVANKPARQAGPRSPGSGIGLAIAGTVIIVLALAGLAVYAYLKTR